jgi:hypothetical protein
VRLTHRIVDCRFQVWIEENYPRFEFGALRYSAAATLKAIDPDAYGREFERWLEGEGYVQEGEDYYEYVPYLEVDL